MNILVIGKQWEDSWWHWCLLKLWDLNKKNLRVEDVFHKSIQKNNIFCDSRCNYEKEQLTGPALHLQMKSSIVLPGDYC